MMQYFGFGASPTPPAEVAVTESKQAVSSSPTSAATSTAAPLLPSPKAVTRVARVFSMGGSEYEGYDGPFAFSSLHHRGTDYTFNLLDRPDNAILEDFFADEGDFGQKREEIAAALAGGSYRDEEEKMTYHYGTCFSPVLRRADTGQVMCAAVVVERVISKPSRNGGKGKNGGGGGGGGGIGIYAPAGGVKTWEVVWFSTLRASRGLGCGSLMFIQLQALAVGTGVTALVIESSNRAVGYWITRPGVPILGVLLRDATRADLRENSGIDDAATVAKLRKLVAVPVRAGVDAAMQRPGAGGGMGGGGRSKKNKKGRPQ